MKTRMPFLALSAVTLLFAGQGCFPGQVQAPQSPGGVFSTPNVGASWTALNTVPSTAGTGTLANEDVVALEMDPSDNKVLYVGTVANGLFVSTDAGVSWQRSREAELQTGYIADVEVNTKDVCTVYAVKGTRLFKTSDCGRTFEKGVYVENRANVMITDVAIDWYDTNTVWLALNNGDIMRSENGGGTWSKVLATGRRAITHLMVSNADSRVVLAATDGDGFYKTTNKGVSWTQIQSSLGTDQYSTTAWTQTADGKHLYVANSGGIMHSENFGDAWDRLKLLSASGEVNIYALGVDPKNTKRVRYAAGITFYSTEDAGTTWATQKLPTTRTPSRMVVDPKDANMVYIGFITPRQ